MSAFEKRLVFLQLPRLDPDVTSPGENAMQAAACLQAALQRSGEGRHWQTELAPDAQDGASDGRLVAALAERQPDAVAATCYLWNVERTLHVLRMLKRSVPNLRVVLGGPEAAREHPLLYRRNSPADVVVIGEGEVVFPDILRALRTGEPLDFDGVATRVRRDRRCLWHWGSQSRSVRPLEELLAAPDAAIQRPDAHGMAYLETNRGCPLRCAFCCYNLRRERGSAIPPADVARRIRILAERGAREIRLVDPTFNAHPDFEAVLRAMKRANPGRRIAFFVELRADTLTEPQVRLLAEAGVAEAEVGIQSTDPRVLRVICRGTNPERIVRGIELLRGHGIRPTIDFMYALPGQGADDLGRSLAWLERFPDAHPQFLPLLLLPGTELRDRAVELGLVAQRLPPYRVVRTDRLSTRALRAVEEDAIRRLGGFDSPTRRFAGQRLPDLFKDRLRIQIDTAPVAGLRPGSNRQAVFLRGVDLYSQRDRISALLRDAVRAEPHVLWQFVLEPADEEPLELLDHLTATLLRLPSHWLDRLVALPGRRCLASRRLLVRPLPGSRVSGDWLAACDALLATVSH